MHIKHINNLEHIEYIDNIEHIKQIKLIHYILRQKYSGRLHTNLLPFI